MNDFLSAFPSLTDPVLLLAYIRSVEKKLRRKTKSGNEHHTSMEDQLEGVDRRLSPGLREEVNGVVLLRGGHELREEVQTSIQ